jgi:hypothetical protein
MHLQTKTDRNFNTFIDLQSLKLEVPMFCLVTGCVSGHRDRRYYELGFLHDSLFLVLLSFVINMVTWGKGSQSSL